ncbi:unnamed protein product [Ixodes pacificus]
MVNVPEGGALEQRRSNMDHMFRGFQPPPNRDPDGTHQALLAILVALHDIRTSLDVSAANHALAMDYISLRVRHVEDAVDSLLRQNHVDR